MIRPVDLLLQYLNDRLERGETHVQLDVESRAWLKQKPVVSAAAPPKEVIRQPSKAQATAPVARLAPEVLPPVKGNLGPELERIRQQMALSSSLKSLGTLRSTLVFSVGSPSARLMLVGEAPGDEDEQRGAPFSGEAGDKLTDILKAMGLTREEVYLTTLVKYRPRMARQTFANRQATPEEIAASLPFLMAEVDVVKPDCIVCLGGTVGNALLSTQMSADELRAKWHRFHEIPTRVTHHPGYLLQSGVGNRIKRQLWEDMLAAMELLKLPISAKQRSYFLPKNA